MKKAKSELNDWPRDEYKAVDLGKIVRGKYAKRFAHATNIVVLDPKVAKVFATDAAFNEALNALIEVAKSSARVAAKSVPSNAKARLG